MKTYLSKKNSMVHFRRTKERIFEALICRLDLIGQAGAIATAAMFGIMVLLLILGVAEYACNGVAL